MSSRTTSVDGAGKEHAARWGASIRRRRKQKGMSQTELASLLGLTQAAVTQWERGVTAPSVDNQLAIAKALDTDPQTLFALLPVAS